MDKTEVSDLLAALSLRIKNNGLDEKIFKTIEVLLEQVENYESIDKEMISTLQSYLGNDLIKKEQYDNIVKAVEDGSVIVYFKSAQLFKIYKKDELYTLLSGQLRTIYKTLNQSYEVVPNQSKQKIIIMGDATLLDSIDRVKILIIKFMREKGIANFQNDDIVCFRNGNMIEIIINNYYVSNSQERHNIVEDLLKYIFKTEKNNNITRQLRNRIDSDFEEAAMITMPSGKQLITQTFVDCIDGLIGNVEKCVEICKSGNTYIFNVNVQNQSAEIINNNNNIAENINVDVNKDMDFVDDFVDFIKLNKPNWFTPGKWIEKIAICNAYSDLYGEVPRNFYGKLRGRIYVSEKRGVKKSIQNKKERILMLKLMDYNELN